MVKSEQKILIVTPLYPPDIGGPATYSHGLLTALKERGTAVEIVTFKEFLPYPSGIRHLLFFARVFKKMKGMDFIIVLDTVSVAVPTVCASLFRKGKVSIRIGGDFVWEQFVERTKKKILLSQFYSSNVTLSTKEKILIWIQRNFVFRFADRIIFSTRWQRDIWRVPYRLDMKKVQIIENAYASEDVSVSPSKSQTIVWIGRDIVLKNVAALDRVMTMVQNDFPHVAYKKYTGINHTEVMRVLKDARILVIPSLSDVSPNLALEAIRMGIPVLLTRDCGLKDVLKDSVTWVDSLDEQDIFTQITKLMNEDEYRRAQVHAQAFKTDRTYTVLVEEFLNEYSVL
jgi:glycosyltransferase involved in cell wall biosynthesis